MSKGVLLGGLLGGILMFVWGFLSHNVIGLGSVGLKQIPSQETVLATLAGTMPEPGLYFYPWMKPSMTEAETEAFQQKWRTGPSGLLAYRPREERAEMQFILVELASNIACAIVAGALLCKARNALASYGRRVLFVALLGLAAWLSLSVSYWNWYGFSAPYILAEGVDQIAGFAFAGLAVAAFVKPDRASEPARP